MVWPLHLSPAVLPRADPTRDQLPGGKNEPAAGTNVPLTDQPHPATRAAPRPPDRRPTACTPNDEGATGPTETARSSQTARTDVSPNPPRVAVLVPSGGRDPSSISGIADA